MRSVFWQTFGIFVFVLLMTVACGSSGGSNGDIKDGTASEDSAGRADTVAGVDQRGNPDTAGQTDTSGNPDTGVQEDMTDSGGSVDSSVDPDAPANPETAQDVASTIPGGWTYTDEGWFALTPASGKKALYSVNTCGPDWVDFEATVDAQADYNGTPCLKIAMNEVGGQRAIVAYADVSVPWQISAFAIEVWDAGDVDAPGMAYRFDPPFVLTMDPTEPHQVSEGLGKMEFGVTEGDELNLIVDSTLESTDATVEVPFGTVTGATHYVVNLKECPPTGECTGTGFPADGWFHPQHLVVKLAVVPGYCEVVLVESWH